MVVGEAPGREEDKTGKPFVGPAGQLLDKMFQAIGFRRFSENNSFYVTNVIPWRPPQNRSPTEDEINLLKPFLIKHIDLIKPEIIILMGNTPCQALLGKSGITKLRGHWKNFLSYPVLPMFHPAYLLRNPTAKKETWQDLKMLKKRLGGDL
jgi:DNA polymerase